MRGTEVDRVLSENLAVAEALGISGIPAFIIGDEVIVGAVGPRRMQAAIPATAK